MYYEILVHIMHCIYKIEERWSILYKRADTSQGVILNQKSAKYIRNFRDSQKATIFTKYLIMITNNICTFLDSQLPIVHLHA